MIHRTAPTILLTLTLASPMAFAQMMHKCSDGKGHTIYSDRACALGPVPTPPKPQAQPASATKAAAAAPAAQPDTSPPPAPAPNTATGGKLSEASVKTVIQYAFDLGLNLDYRGQCALAAPDLQFSITDKTASPTEEHSGGRKQLCDLEKEAAIAAQSVGMRFNGKIQKLAIRLNSDSTQATANYEIVTTISVQGQTMLRQLCTQQDTLAVYDGKILFKGANSVCKSQTP